MEKSIYQLHEDLVLLKTEIDWLYQKSKHPEIIDRVFKHKELKTISNLVDLQREQIKELKEETTHLKDLLSQSERKNPIDPGASESTVENIIRSIGGDFIDWADDYFSRLPFPWPRLERDKLYRSYLSYLEKRGLLQFAPAHFICRLQQWCLLRGRILNGHIVTDRRQCYPRDVEGGVEYITITIPS